MNEAAPYAESTLLSPDVAGGNLEQILSELEHYRRQSQWLARVNELHARLAGALDLPSMIEAFSVWLTPLVQHDLIAYNNPERGRTHLFCSCHGPERRQVVQVAERMFVCFRERHLPTCWRTDGFAVRNWLLASRQGSGHLLLLRRGRDFTTEEIRTVDRALEILNEPLQRAVDYEDLFEQAQRDTLTGLANRRVFDERIGSILESARRHGRPVTLASMDLDKFKQINDTLGHAVGDQVLRQVALTFSAMVRGSDLLVRMGGDEFLLVMPDTDLVSAQVLAERLCRAVDGLDIRSASQEKLGVSIGLVQWQEGLSKEEWIQRTDELLYQAKFNGRSQVCVSQ